MRTVLFFGRVTRDAAGDSAFDEGVQGASSPWICLHKSPGLLKRSPWKGLGIEEMVWGLGSREERGPVPGLSWARAEGPWGACWMVAEGGEGENPPKRGRGGEKRPQTPGGPGPKPWGPGPQAPWRPGPQAPGAWIPPLSPITSCKAVSQTHRVSKP